MDADEAQNAYTSPIFVVRLFIACLT